MSNNALEICFVSSTQRKIFRHWDLGQVFLANFQNQEAWKESDAKKIQHLKDLACPILIKIDTKIHSGTLNMIKDENKNLGFWVSPIHLKPHFRASAPIVKLHPADLARCYGK